MARRRRAKRRPLWPPRADGEVAAVHLAIGRAVMRAVRRRPGWSYRYAPAAAPGAMCLCLMPPCGAEFPVWCSYRGGRFRVFVHIHLAATLCPSEPGFPGSVAGPVFDLVARLGGEVYRPRRRATGFRRRGLRRRGRVTGDPR